MIDVSKKNTYPKKCIDGFINHVKKHFNISNSIDIEYNKQINSLYKYSVAQNIKTKEDMYDSIKDNAVVKEIENVFDAKIDKENITKL